MVSLACAMKKYKTNETKLAALKWNKCNFFVLPVQRKPRTLVGWTWQQQQQKMRTPISYYRCVGNTMALVFACDGYQDRDPYFRHRCVFLIAAPMRLEPREEIQKMIVSYKFSIKF